MEMQITAAELYGVIHGFLYMLKQFQLLQN